ncbi:glycosyltransferase [Clostridium sp. UBA1652]|uniref:glycosyltransferase n=1 Tax=Clostridium sp. UBA1652 TaxID=1946348 RepID=UPI00257FB200|nr:glycosyltransferase [Clostridium sp. UBA1652]
MNFVIITIGSRGDVQPFLALGRGLKKKGHKIRICAMSIFKEVIEQEGFEYAPMAGDAKEIMIRLIGEQVSSLEYFRNLPFLLNPVKAEFLSNIEDACEGMDTILYSTLGSVAYHVGEKLGICCFRCFFAPLDPTSEFPAMTAPRSFLGGCYNKLTFKGGDILWSNATRNLLNDWRVQMGLKKIKAFEFPYRSMNGKPITTLYAYSPTLAPKPKEYGEHQHITGFWIKELDKEWRPDENLKRFLAEGSKPMYIGFGSTVGGDFNRIIKVVLESLKITGQRAIISAGWRNLKYVDFPSNVIQVENVPHEWLFPKMLAVSHHGGAGTTAAGVRSGVPSIIIPFGGDQPYWGERVYEMGVGTKPIWCKKLSVENYTKAIRDVLNNQKMRNRASEIGEVLKSENGVQNAVTLIEETLNM